MSKILHEAIDLATGETMSGDHKELREGSAPKRGAILASARELFLSEGFDRVSVDAISSRAGVSKRTVYDYYGDKRTLLLAVIEQAVAGLGAVIDAAIDDTLSGVETTDQLEASLVSFAQAITASAIGSSDYAALMRLITTGPGDLDALRAHAFPTREPEDQVAERFADFGRRRLLEVPDPRLAADVFVALTLSWTTNTVGRDVDADDERTTRLIAEGVRVFLRGYAATAGPRSGA